MLFRLQLCGVDVGDRWVELADKAEQRICDTLSAFTLPHWMMALVATGRRRAALTMMAEMDSLANANNAGVVERIALPICDAVFAFGEGRYAEAVRVMRPVLGEMYRLGGSHAQQDVLEQLFLHAAIRADLDDDARLLLERVAGRHPVPVRRRIGYRDAAARLGFS
jgi:hypothetical protein